MGYCQIRDELEKRLGAKELHKNTYRKDVS